MFLFIKDFVVVGISILVALLIFLGIAPENVPPPEITPPEIVIEVPQEELIATSTTEVKKDEIETPIVVENQPRTTPSVEDFEKSLQEALDALAKIQEEELAKKSVPEQGLNATVRNAVVNILCTTTGAGPLNPISASGVIIDPQGIILINAHVGQYFLLENYPIPGFIDCVVRTGSPAKPLYTVDLLFLPPSWIEKNAHKIDDEAPTGNGEHDYAFIQITGGVSSNVVVPDTFPYLPIALAAPAIGDPMLLAGYPAGFLGGVTIQKELYAASASVTVQEVYTFKENAVDLFSIGGSVVAQQGSSGGAAARNDGSLSGLIVTSSSAESTGGRDLRAIATSYIIRDFANERGISLANYLSRDLNTEKLLFMQNTAPTLSAALISVLEQ